MSDLDPISNRPPPRPPPRLDEAKGPAQAQQPQAPARPAARSNVPGSSDSFESRSAMESRAAQAKLLGQTQPQPAHAVAPTSAPEGTLRDVTEGVVSRNERLSRANVQVQQHEAKLGQHLEHLAPTMKTPAEQQKYADAYRQ